MRVGESANLTTTSMLTSTFRMTSGEKYRVSVF